MRLNLRKINQLIREAWIQGQKAAVTGMGPKSASYAWSTQVARDYFPDIRSDDVSRIAEGKARLHWDAEKREIVVVPTAANEPTEPSAKYRTIAIYEGPARDPLLDLDGPPPKSMFELFAITTDEGRHLYIDNVKEGRCYRVTVEEKGP